MLCCASASTSDINLLLDTCPSSESWKSFCLSRLVMAWMWRCQWEYHQRESFPPISPTKHFWTQDRCHFTDWLLCSLNGDKISSIEMSTSDRQTACLQGNWNDHIYWDPTAQFHKISPRKPIPGQLLCANISVQIVIERNSQIIFELPYGLVFE